MSSEALETRTVLTPIIGATETVSPTSQVPGGTLTYTVVITNTAAPGAGNDATGVQFTDVLDPNTTQIGNVMTSVLGFNDSYSALGNVAISIPAGTGLLANDVDPDGIGPALTVSAGTTSTQGGTVAVSSNGSFTYEPAPGFEGTDTFTYTVNDNEGNTDTATVTLTVSGMIWFVDQNAGSNGDGRLAHPFNTLAAFTAINDGGNGGLNPAANDNIFLYESATNYTGPITLLNGQKLIGQDATTSLVTLTGVSLPTGSASLPAMNSGNGTVSRIVATGNDVTLGSGNSLYGFTAGNATGVAISGSSFGTLNVQDVTINTTGAGLSLTTGSFGGSAAFNSITSTGGANGVSLTTIGGSVNLGGGALSGNTGVSFNVSGGTGTVTYNGTISKSNAASAVAIASKTGGAINLGGVITASTSTATAIDLISNTGAAINFTGGSLDIDTTSGTGFNATSGGTISVQGSGNSITSTTGTALNVANTTIGSSDLTFQSITAGTGAASAGVGISLDSTGASGGLHVTGLDGGDAGSDPDAGSGGTIQHKTGADGSNTSGIGIYLNNTFDVQLAGMQLNDFDNAAIRGFSVTAFRFTYSTISGASGNSTGATEGAITFGTSNPGGANGLLGTGASASVIDHVDVSGAIEHTIEVYNQSGSFGLTISNSNIHDNSVAGGSDGILIEMQGTASATVNIATNTFSNNKSQAIQVAANDSSSVNLTISGNTITRGTQGNEGIVVSNGSDADLTTLISGNNISGFGGVGIFVGQTAGNATSSSLLQATISGNTITAPTTATNHAIIAFLTSTVGQVSQARILIDNNTVTQNSTTGVARGILVDTPDTSTSPNLNATVTNNTVHIMDNVAGVGGIVVQARKASTGHFDVRNNTVDFPNGNPGVNGLRVRQTDTATAELARGVDPLATAVATVLADNNTSSTTEVLGTVTVINNGVVLLPASPALPLLFAPSEDDEVNEQVMSDTPQPPINDSGVTPPVDESPTIGDDGVLSRAKLDSLVTAATARWEATGLTAAQISLLHNVTFSIEDLPGWYLGEAGAGVITLDSNAAGNSWFIDATPFDDSEFTGTGTDLYATQNGGAAGRIDALTTVLHELGHQLGLEDSYLTADSADLMYGWIHQSERRLPALGQADGVVPHAHDGLDFAFSPISIGTLPAGKSITITFQATINNPTSATSVSSQGTVGGSNFANVLTDDPSVAGAANPTVATVLHADVGVTKTDGTATAVPGQSTTYTIVVSNTGGAAATGATFTDNFPGGITGATWTSVAAGGATGNTASSSGNISETLDLPIGGSVTYTVTANISASATGSLVNTATVSHIDDVTSGNNSATDTDTLTPQTDVAVTKTDGVTTAIPGLTTLTYTIVVSNSGPSVATSTSLTDNFPAGLTGVTWTSLAASGATGNTASSSGNISQTLSLPVGASVTYTVTGSVSPDATGNLVNTATVSQANDTNSGNDGATDTDTLTPQTDVSVTKDDGTTNATPGSSTTYTIIVTNSGPSTAFSTSLTDNFPAEITSANWTSVAAGGATGNTASSSGNISETLTIPVGATVTYTVTANISAGASGNLVNTGTVSQTNDTNAGNDSATDTDTLGNPVSIVKLLDAAEAATDGRFRVSQLQVTGTDTVVTYSVTGTASDGTDYTTLSGTVTILAGDTFADIDVFVQYNNVVEGTETVIVTLTGFTASDPNIILDPNVANRTATVNITDDDTATYTVSDATVTEGGDLSFTVSLSNPVDVDTTVNLTFSDGTTSVGDFDHTLIPVTFLAGTNTAQVFLIPTVVDSTVEADETLTANLALAGPLPSGASSNVTDTGAGTITNDDTATYSISDATITEGGDLSFTVSLSNPVDGDTTVNLTFADGSTLTGDFNHTTVPVTFLAGDNTPQVILISTVTDNTVEDDETFTVNLALSAPLTSGRLSDTTDTGAGTIINDDTATYSISDATVTEGGDLSFTVSLSNPVDVDTTVNVTFTDGTTSAGDFNHTLIPVTFLAGNNSAQVILVPTVADNTVEADETFMVNLALSSALTGGRLSNTTDTGTGTITNDDTATYAISDATVTEGGNLSFTVSLSNPVDVDTTVNVTFSDGTTSAGDFNHATVPVTFLAGNNSAQVTLVSTVGDNLVEDDETLTASLALSAPLTGGRLSDTTDTGAGTITNDDTATYAISDASVTEGGDLSFTVSLSNPVDVDTTVNVTFSDGTTAAGDFDHTPLSVTILAGSNLAQVILVSTVVDNTVEANETFTASLALTAPLTGGRLSNTADTGSGTITNDDTATYSISDATVTEGGDLSFTVSLSNPVDLDTTVNVTFTDGTTSAGDFNHTLIPVTFLAGTNSAQVILVPTVSDNTVEANETFTANLTLSTPLTGGRLSNTSDTGTGTITNDDTATYTISDATVTEGGDLSFTVSLSNPVDVNTTVNVTFSDGTTSAGDFNHATVPVTFLAGINSAQVILISTVGDNLVEDDETLTANLALSAPVTSGRLSTTTDTGAGTITNDDTATYTISNASITEGGDLSFTVSLSNPVDVDTAVTVSFSDGSTSANDFNHTALLVTFLAGSNSAQVILIATVGDNIVEGDETLSAQLALTAQLTGARVSYTTDTGTGTILNNDTTTLTITSETVVEGNAGTTPLVFTVTSPNAVQDGFTVEFTVNGVTADGADYTVVTPSPLVFSGVAGETLTITLNVIGDTLGEDNETFSVTLVTVTPVAPTLPASIVSGAVGTGTIENDDTVIYTIDDVTVTESDGTLVFALTADHPLDIDVTVDVTFTNGTAGAADYDSTTQQITFLAGETTKQVVVSIDDDNIVEATENFTASLSSTTPTGGRTLIFTDIGTGTITDNDTATFTIYNVTVSEADGSLVFDLVTDKPLDIDVTIDVMFTDGSATGGGTDYASSTQSITFLAGQTTKPVTVAINNDAIVEATETFTVALGTGTTLGGRSVTTSDTATGTITDNDVATFTINNVTVNEADGSLVFDLVTDKPLDLDVMIDVTFTDGTATGNGTDYASTTQHITFLAGETTKSVTVAINDDNIVEATEGFSVALGTTTPLGGRSVNVNDTGTGTITDNDTATFTIDDVTVGEDAGTLVFNLATDKPLDIDVTIDVTFTAGSATGGGTDFTSTTQQITFLAGQTSKPVSVAINNDAIVEATETFTVALGTGTALVGRSVTTTDTGTGTITDSDVATVSIAKIADGAEANSPTNGKFRITQSAVSSTDTVVNYTIDGTATAGAGNDYTTLSGTATIPAGQTTVDINVLVLNDVLIESTESVIVTLTGFGTHDPDITLDVTEATVNITNDDKPTITSGAITSFAENTPATTVVLNVDADPAPLAPGHTLSYSLSGPDSSLFDIDSATGEIRFKTSPNFEAPTDQDTNNLYQVTVTATADTIPAQATSQNLTISVTPVNDITPVFTNPAPTFEVAENTADGTVVGSVPATDGDLPAQALTYSIVSGNLGGAFTIHPATGQITVASSTSLNFEVVASFTLTVRVTDNTPTARTADAIVTINVTNVVENPTITIANPEGTYHAGRFPAMIFIESTYIYDDVAHPNYEGAKVTVSIVSGRSRKDKLTIVEQGAGAGQINTKGHKLFLGSTQFGTFKGGKGRNADLEVILNANATTAGVASLIRRINFQAKDGIGTERAIHIQITNIAGVDSNIATRNISVVP